MSLLSLHRIKDLREVLEAEDISYGELAEINDAFLQIPEEELPEPRENAMASDQLDELEQRVTPLEREVFNWVAEHFGENEAMDPSWDIGALTNNIESKFNVEAK